MNHKKLKSSWRRQCPCPTNKGMPCTELWVQGRDRHDPACKRMCIEVDSTKVQDAYLQERKSMLLKELHTGEYKARSSTKNPCRGSLGTWGGRFESNEEHRKFYVPI